MLLTLSLFRLPRYPRFAACFLALIAAPAADAAPIATSTALPVADNGLVLREQVAWMSASDELNGVRRESERFELRTTAVYGITPKLALFAMLPLVDMDSMTGTTRRSVSGIADAALFARYEVFRANGPGRTLRVAPYAGLRLPTGEEGKTGDGSLDVFGGIVLTVASTDWGIDSQLRYDHNREANGVKRGDKLTADTSLQFRLAPSRVAGDTQAFLFGVLELSAAHHDRSEVAGLSQAETGGFQLFLTPGLQYATRRWIVDFGVRTAIVDDLRGSPLQADYTVLTSIRLNF